MYITDGKKVLEINMEIWESDEYKRSIDREFFEDAKKYNRWIDAALVEDLDYCVDQANDWKYGRGDYKDDLEGLPGHNPVDRLIDIEDITEKFDQDDIENELAYT